MENIRVASDVEEEIDHVMEIKMISLGFLKAGHLKVVVFWERLTKGFQRSVSPLFAVLAPF